MIFDQDLCLLMFDGTCDMTETSYFGKLNLTLVSVVPLAMFLTVPPLKVLSVRLQLVNPIKKVPGFTIGLALDMR